MPKILKILLRLIGGILEWLLIILILLMFAIRTSPFQTFLARQATDYLSKELKTTMSIKKVDIFFFDRVALDGIFILDQQKDTLLDLKSLFVNLNSIKSKIKIIDIDEIKLKEGKVKLNRSEKDGKFNFQFIVDYFETPDTTSSDPYEVKLNTIKLSKINFKYDDWRKKKTDFGLDYAHLHLKNLDFEANEFKMFKAGGISAKIKELSLKDRSGLEIKSFQSNVAFDSKGLR